MKESMGNYDFFFLSFLYIFIYFCVILHTDTHTHIHIHIRTIQNPSQIPPQYPPIPSTKLKSLNFDRNLNSYNFGKKYRTVVNLKSF